MAHSLHSLIAFNSENKIKSDILEQLSLKFNKFKLSEQSKETPNQDLINFFDESSKEFHSSRRQYADIKSENIRKIYANYKEPFLDEVSATILAEEQIKEKILAQNESQINRNKYEFNIPTPVSSVQSQDEKITINLPSEKEVDPNIHPLSDVHIYQPQKYIITRSDGSKIYTNLLKISNKPITLKYSGAVDFVDIRLRCIIYCPITKSLEIITTLERILALGQQRGYTKTEHLTLIFRSILQEYFPNVFTSYIDDFCPNSLFEILIGLYKPYEVRQNIENAISEIVRKPNETISSISCRLLALHIKKFKLDQTSKSNPTERAKRTVLYLISDYTVQVVKEQIDTYVQANTKLGNQPKLDDVLEFINILESEPQNKPTSDLTSSKFQQMHLFMQNARPQRNIPRKDYNMKRLQDKSFRRRSKSSDAFSPSSHSSPNRPSSRSKNRERFPSNSRKKSLSRSRGSSVDYDKHSSYPRSQSKSPSNLKPRDKNDDQFLPYHKNSYKANERSRSRSRYNPEDDIILIKKYITNDIFCLRCLSSKHLTKTCRLYSTTATNLCKCTAGYHYFNKCLNQNKHFSQFDNTSVNRRPNSNHILNKYTSRSPSHERENASFRPNSRSKSPKSVGNDFPNYLDRKN